MVQHAGQIIEQALAGAATGSPYAILDYPNYLNPGDAAIWVGARTILERVMGGPPSYISTLRNFDARHCRDIISDGTVFFLGGGNFGSLYPRHHRMRLRTIEQAANANIVLLPLSVADPTGEGEDPQQVAETRAVLERCARLQVLSREAKSQSLLHEVYGVESRLCPDTAHCCSPPAVKPHTATICLLRSDREVLSNRFAGGIPQCETVFDWTDSPELSLINRVGKLSPHIPIQTIRLALFDQIARRKLNTAFRLLGRGNSVLTDRLHGVILASLLGRDVTAADNATGKVGSYIASWQHLLPGVWGRQSD